jgi:tryptophan synthase beta subunit
MGSEDVMRQSPIVYRMKLLGATVVPLKGKTRQVTFEPLANRCGE